jgi:polyphosphate kinase 2 (PPK2 family)
MMRPWLWRFWMKIPSYGEMAIFDRSWYGRVLVERVRKLTVMSNWLRAYEEINDFERLLANDGMIFIKFWLHISKEEQLRRFIRLTQDPEQAWQITAEDWENHRQYEEYLAAVQDMLANTHTDGAPWSVVAATDRNYRLCQVYKEIIDTLERALRVEPTRWESLINEG